MASFLTLEVMIGPFEILEVSDCNLVRVITGLLELEVIMLAGAFAGENISLFAP